MIRFCHTTPGDLLGGKVVCFLFEVKDLPKAPKGVDGVSVELWDCSGDRAQEDCWPALALNTNGAIIVLDAERDLQQQGADVW